jgi:short-subunit dehydrogenase
VEILNKNVLITGASGGIGYELAKIFAEEGCNLVLVARSEDKLMKIKKQLERQYEILIELIIKDLSVKDAAEDIYNILLRNNVDVDILVNNAGFGDFGDFAHADWDKQYSMIQVNIAALIHMTRLFLKPMVERGYGKILNLSSTAAFQPGPFMSIYYASKAFVLSFSESLSKELDGSGVTVTALCPGPTQTGFVDAASLENSKLFKTIKVSNVEDVAIFGYKALMNGKTVAIHGFTNKLLAFGVRLIPRSLVREIMYGLQKKVKKM